MSGASSFLRRLKAQEEDTSWNWISKALGASSTRTKEAVRFPDEPRRKLVGVFGETVVKSCEEDAGFLVRNKGEIVQWWRAQPASWMAKAVPRLGPLNGEGAKTEGGSGWMGVALGLPAATKARVAHSEQRLQDGELDNDIRRLLEGKLGESVALIFESALEESLAEATSVGVLVLMETLPAKIQAFVDSHRGAIEQLGAQAGLLYESGSPFKPSPSKPSKLDDNDRNFDFKAVANAAAEKAFGPLLAKLGKASGTGGDGKVLGRLGPRIIYKD